MSRGLQWGYLNWVNRNRKLRLWHPKVVALLQFGATQEWAGKPCSDSPTSITKLERRLPRKGEYFLTYHTQRGQNYNSHVPWKIA